LSTAILPLLVERSTPTSTTATSTAWTTRRSRAWTRSGAWSCSIASTASWSTMPPPCRSTS